MSNVVEHPGTPGDFSSAFENAAIGMSLVAPDHRRLRVNRAFCQMLGYSADELMALTVRQVAVPEDAAEDLRQRAVLLRGEKTTYEREKRYLRKDGGIVWGHTTCTLVRDGNGMPVHFIVQVQDITQRKHAESLLRESEARFRSLTALSADWYWEQDAELRFTAFSGNNRSEALRPDQASALGQRRWEGDDIQPISCSWEEHQAALAARLPFRDFEYMRALPGGERYYVCSGVPIIGLDGAFTGYRGTARDITESRQAALNQHILGERLTATLESLTDAFFTLDADWRVIYVNSQAEYLLRTARAELLGREVWAVLPTQVAAAVKDRWLEAVRSGASVQFEYHHEPLGIWAQMRAYPSSQGLAIYVRDVSEVNAARVEIFRLNAELEQRVRDRTAQLEAAYRDMESFSYSIAHDLRAPLSSISGFASALEHYDDTPPERRAHFLARIRAGVKYMDLLTDGLLVLSRLSRKPIAKEPVDLSRMAQAVVAARREADPQRRVTVRIEPGLQAHGDPALIGQVLENLLGNAWKFTARQPDSRITVGRADEAGDTTYFVRDNGAGFDMAGADKLFQAFHRLHGQDEFEGTGIGLTIVQRIVLRHGGRIWAQAAPGRGATFFFTLPH